MTMSERQKQTVGEVLVNAVLGTTDGDVLTEGSIPVEEVARLLREEAPYALLRADQLL